MISDIKTLYNLVRPNRGANHQERLEHFYADQSHDYDRFRERLLTNRQELFDGLPLHEGDRLLDVGAGTGRNIAFLGERRAQLSVVTLLDLCGPLLDVARQRIARESWDNVSVEQADATKWLAAEPYQCITFSYSLTMIPDWYRAIDQAIANLAPGGTLAAVDFYSSRKHPRDGMVKHGYLRRHFWPWWFGHDNVQLHQDMLPYLCDRLEAVEVTETLAPVPYVLGKVPVFRFMGRKAR